MGLVVLLLNLPFLPFPRTHSPFHLQATGQNGPAAIKLINQGEILADQSNPKPTNQTAALHHFYPIKPSNFKRRRKRKEKKEKSRHPSSLPPLSPRPPKPLFSPSAVEIQRSPTTVGARFASNPYRSPATYAGKGVD